MNEKSNAKYWIIWLAGTLGLGGWLAYGLAGYGEPTRFMPGPLSPGHHQLAEACEVCHTERFGGTEVLQQACVDCHGAQRRKPFDSHPRAKFTDPRNADLLARIDALNCVGCHTEHRPEITAKDGLTQPRDFCLHCHAGIGDDRPSHQGMEFMTCKDAGCHNYHDNRAIYTDFLVKHLDDPDTRPDGRVPAREFGERVEEMMDYPHDRYPVGALDATDADAPPASRTSQVMDDWLATAHARAGVNCSGCHQPPDDTGTPGVWTDHPGASACRDCHALEQRGFEAGRHGMRLAAGLSPMPVADAVLPMQDAAAHRRLDCLSCHGAHRFDTRAAAVEACLECHADPHSLAYRGSPHHRAWEREVAGAAAAGSGVSCATCHLPRIDQDVNDWMSRIAVDHNQSAALSPATKMIRPACLHCHGLGFALDALADRALVGNNFAGRPAVRVESMALARADHERHLRELEQRRAGPDSAGAAGTTQQQ